MSPVDIRTLLVIIVTSLVTAAATSGIGHLAWMAQERKRDRDAQAKDRANAYAELCTAAYLLAGKARNVAVVAEYRSGWSDGVLTALGRRHPADLEKLMDGLSDHFSIVFSTYTKLGIHASQEASDIADQLMIACSEVLSVCIQASREGWRRKLVNPFKWTAKKEAEFDEILKRLARNRIELMKLARKEVGQKPIVFAIDENSPITNGQG